MILKDRATKHIKELKILFERAGVETDDIILKEFNYEFNAISGKTRAKVQIFFGKKGLKLIVQGNTTSVLYNSIKDIIYAQQTLNLGEPKTNEPDEYIGSDECGKGDFFGPLVIAAAYVNKKTQEELRKIGVRDSKDISDYQIHNFAREIKKTISDNYEIVRINPEKYNQLYKKFNNLNKLLNWAHSKAIDSLLQKVKCNVVITDKFSNRDLDVRTNSNHHSVEFIQETGAEKFTAVAAASILARDSFNNWFNKMTKKGFTLPKGSSNNVDEKALFLLNKLGEEEFGKFAKLHFKTFNKIKKT